MNNISIAELFQGKETIIKDKEFFSTKIYTEPFIEKMSKFTDDFRIQVVLPEQVTKTKNKEDITYNRVLIQAVLPEKYCIDNHDEVIGFLYGIDVRKPVVKLYRGYLNRACTNLCVFSPTLLNTQDLIPGQPININPIKELLEYQNTFPGFLKTLKETYLSRDERKRYLGEWVDYSLREYEDYGFGKVKISASTPINAYKELFINQDSEYYIPEGMDPTLFDIYGSFTQIITDGSKRDILNSFEKTVIVGRMLKVQY